MVYLKRKRRNPLTAEVNCSCQGETQEKADKWCASTAGSNDDNNQQYIYHSGHDVKGEGGGMMWKGTGKVFAEGCGKIVRIHEGRRQGQG